MPTALLLRGPRALDFESFEHPPLGPEEVRIRTLYSGVSAGTELSQYRGTSPFMAKRWDEASRAVPRRRHAELGLSGAQPRL